MQIGFVGLGKMGGRMVEKLLQNGHEIVLWNRSYEPIKNLQLKISKLQTRDSLEIARNFEALVRVLEKPRVIWCMLPAGEPTEEVLSEIGKYLEKDDIVIDGGNANFNDTQRRYEEFKKRKIRFLGIGVSGGIIAVNEGYPLMAGGSRTGFLFIRPILRSLSKPNGGYEYFGEGGAGHFVKMVHNGIEYGIMQSFGEGYEVLKGSPYKLDLLKITDLWQKGTIISGFLLDRVYDALVKDKKLSKIVGFIEESGEAKWTVEQAKKEGVPVEIIEKSLEYRIKSQKDKSVQKSFTAKMVAALRREFGGHAVRER